MMKDLTRRERLQRVLGIHFDPEGGAPYWLERAAALGLDVRRDIETVEDLAVFGPMDQAALACRPVEDFIPTQFHQERGFYLAETGGTLGQPKFAVHRHDEFEAAFIDPFCRAAERCAFPRDSHWLFIGPTGPHIIGKADARCAQVWGRGDCFAVDFDPRWAKKLVPGSFAAKRYLDHVQDQALRVLETQSIQVIFSTPAVLGTLCDRLDESRRLAIKGLHLGGMSASEAFMQTMAEKWPNAVILSGYGNTLFGMMPQLAYSAEKGMSYYPLGDRLCVRLVPDSSEAVDLTAQVDYDQRGQVVIHRFDEMQLILNMVERDTAVRIRPIKAAVDLGFCQDGVQDVQPIVSQATPSRIGLY
jgi:thienamycin biosynthesis protein ThnN